MTERPKAYTLADAYELFRRLKTRAGGTQESDSSGDRAGKNHFVNSGR
jgi:hypothetical protein